jgi:AcrR family transcriptional regulator
MSTETTRRDPSAAEEGDTRQRILDVAEQLLLQRGYAGFSYQDIAEAVGIRKASIHHHFPAKEDLGAAIVERGRAWLMQSRGPIAADAEGILRQFDRYLRFFERLVAEGDRLCLGGRLSADLAILPAPVRDPFRDFSADHLAWRTELFTAGQALGVFQRNETPQDQALMLGAAVQGAVQVARTRGDADYFRRIAAQLRRQFLVTP